MDDIFDNFPGASSKNNYQYPDNDDKLGDNLLDCYDSKKEDYLHQIQRPDNLFYSGTNDYETIPLYGLKSIDNSYDHDKFLRGPSFYPTTNQPAYPEQPDIVPRQQPMMIDTPKYNETRPDKFINSPKNLLAQSLHNLTNQTSNIKGNQHAFPHQQQQFMTESEIHKRQEQYLQHYKNHNQQNQRQPPQRPISMPPLPPQFHQGSNNLSFAGSSNTPNQQFGYPQKQPYPHGQQPMKLMDQRQASFRNLDRSHSVTPAIGKADTHHGLDFPLVLSQNSKQPAYPNFHMNGPNPVHVQPHMPLFNGAGMQHNINMGKPATVTLQSKNITSVRQPNNNSSSMAGVSQVSIPLTFNKNSEKPLEQQAKISLSMSPVTHDRVHQTANFNKLQHQGSFRNKVTGNPPNFSNNHLMRNSEESSAKRAVVTIDFKKNHIQEKKKVDDDNSKFTLKIPVKVPQNINRGIAQKINSNQVMNENIRRQGGIIQQNSNRGVIKIQKQEEVEKKSSSKSSNDSLMNHRSVSKEEKSMTESSLSNLMMIDLDAQTKQQKDLNKEKLSNIHDISSLISEIEDNLSFNSNKAILGKNKKKKDKSPQRSGMKNYDFQMQQRLGNIQIPIKSQNPIIKQQNQAQNINSEILKQRQWVKSKGISDEAPQQLLMNKIDTPMQEDLQINLDNTGNNKIQFKNENNKFIEMNKEVINLQEIMETYQRLQNMSISTENFNKQEYSRVKYQLEQEIISKIQALNTNKHLKNFIDQSQLQNLGNFLQNNTQNNQNLQQVYNAQIFQNNVPLIQEPTDNGIKKSSSSDPNTSHQAQGNQNSASERPSLGQSSCGTNKNNSNGPNPNTIDQSNHQNISIQKYYKQDVIFNFHLANSEVNPTDSKNPGAQPNGQPGQKQPPTASPETDKDFKPPNNESAHFNQSDKGEKDQTQLNLIINSSDKAEAALSLDKSSHNLLTNKEHEGQIRVSDAEEKSNEISVKAQMFSSSFMSDIDVDYDNYELSSVSQLTKSKENNLQQQQQPQVQPPQLQQIPDQQEIKEAPQIVPKVESTHQFVAANPAPQRLFENLVPPMQQHTIQQMQQQQMQQIQQMQPMFPQMPMNAAVMQQNLSSMNLNPGMKEMIKQQLLHSQLQQIQNNMQQYQFNNNIPQFLQIPQLMQIPPQLVINQAQIDMVSVVAQDNESRQGSPLNLNEFNESILNFELYDEQMAKQKSEITMQTLQLKVEELIQANIFLFQAQSQQFISKPNLQEPSELLDMQDAQLFNQLNLGFKMSNQLLIKQNQIKLTLQKCQNNQGYPPVDNEIFIGSLQKNLLQTFHLIETYKAFKATNKSESLGETIKKLDWLLDCARPSSQPSQQPSQKIQPAQPVQPQQANNVVQINNKNSQKNNNNNKSNQKNKQLQQKGRTRKESGAPAQKKRAPSKRANKRTEPVADIKPEIKDESVPVSVKPESIKQVTPVKEQEEFSPSKSMSIERPVQVQAVLPIDMNMSEFQPEESKSQIERAFKDVDTEMGSPETIPNQNAMISAKTINSKISNEFLQKRKRRRSTCKPIFNIQKIQRTGHDEYLGSVFNTNCGKVIEFQPSEKNFDKKMSEVAEECMRKSSTSSLHSNMAQTSIEIFKDSSVKNTNVNPKPQQTQQAVTEPPTPNQSIPSQIASVSLKIPMIPKQVISNKPLALHDGNFTFKLGNKQIVTSLNENPLPQVFNPSSSQQLLKLPDQIPDKTVFRLPIVRKSIVSLHTRQQIGNNDIKSIIANYESDLNDEQYQEEIDLNQFCDSVQEEKEEPEVKLETPPKKRNVKATKKQVQKQTAAKKQPAQKKKTQMRRPRRRPKALIAEYHESNQDPSLDGNKEEPSPSQKASPQADQEMELVSPIKVEHDQSEYVMTKMDHLDGVKSKHSLVTCDLYQSFHNQPYQIFFTFEVQILMHIHSYLSKNEVIGLLGGKCFETSQFVPGTRDKIKILVVTKIYPAQSSISIPKVRHTNCEISPEDQIKIQEQMDKDSVQKLAWYHSHPVFDVDPSIQDLQTHYQQQVSFDRTEMPFFGVILGPYSTKQSQESTQMRVFHLKDNQLQKPFHRTAKINNNLQEWAKAFQFKVIPISKLKYQMYSVIKAIIKDGASHIWDRPKLDQEWAPSKKAKGKLLYYQKMILSIKKISDVNLESLPLNESHKEIKNQLTNEVDRYYFDFHINGLDPQDERDLLKQHGADIPKVELLEKLFTRQAQKSNMYFSISDSQKVQKFLLKIEQCLFKNFGFEHPSFLESLFSGEDKPQLEDQQRDSSLKLSECEQQDEAQE